jgi:uncharacterized protein YqeY
MLQVLRKLVKSNHETIAALTDAEQRAILEREIEVLEAFLPRTLNVAQIRELLAPVVPQIRAAAGPGPAMGIAMKLIKAEAALVESRDVQLALSEIRSGT